MFQELNVQADTRSTPCPTADEILHSVNDIVWAIALPTYDLIHISSAIEALCGCSASKLLQKSKLWLDVIHRDDCAHVLGWLNLVQAVSPSEHQFRIVGADGRIQHLWCRAIRILNNDGQPIRIQGIAHIISPNHYSNSLETQHRYNSIVENAVEGIFQTTPGGRYVIANHALAELYGYDSPSILINQLNDISNQLYVDPDTRNRFIDAIEKQDRVSGFEAQVRRRDGTVIWISESARAIRDEQGTVLYYEGMVEDITARKQAELDLCASEEKFRAIFDQAGTGIAEVGCSGQFLRVNQYFCDLLGYTEDELLQRSFQDVTHPEDIDQNLAHHNALFEGTLSTFSYEKRYVHKDGKTIWANLSVSVLHDQQGLPLSNISIIADISDRKQAEEELRRSQEMLRLIIDNLPQRIFWKDTSLTYLGCNQSQAIAAGLQSPEDIVGKTDYDLPWTKDQAEYYRVCDGRVIDHNTPKYNIPESQWQADGKLVWLEANKIPLRDPHGNVIGLVGTVKDITEHKRTEEALRLQIQQKNTLNKVIQTIRDSLDLPTIFNTTASQTLKLFNAIRVCIIQYQPEQACWQFVTDCHEQATSPILAGTTIVDPHHQFVKRLQQSKILSLTGEQFCQLHTDCLLSGQPMLGHWTIVPLLIAYDDLQASSPSRLREQHSYTMWGCLCIMTASPDAISHPAEQEMAQVIANQLAIAIQQSELCQRIQQFNLELEQKVQLRTHELQHALTIEAMLKRITDNVRDSLDEQDIFEVVVKELSEILVLDCCNITIYNMDAKLSYIRQEYTTIDLCPLTGHVESMADNWDIYQQLVSGKTFQFSKIVPHPLRPDYYPTILCCPIISDHEVLGDLWLYRPRFANFSNLEIGLVEQIVSQCAIAIRQARLYQAAQAQVNELERINHMKDDFLSTVSHELRTPVANIKMAAQMLEIVLAPCQVSDSQACTYLQILQDEAQQEMDLINDLLDLQHLNAGTRPLELVSITLQEWIPHIAEAFYVRTQEHQQTLTVNIAPTLPTIHSDLVSLQRILSELLNNACKYTPPGESITVYAAPVDAETVTIIVQNTGVQIAREELPRIFDKFYRVPQSDRWKHGGTGLGLALVRELARHLGGKLTVTSDRHSTRFTLQLPNYAAGRVKK